MTLGDTVEWRHVRISVRVEILPKIQEIANRAEQGRAEQYCVRSAAIPCTTPLETQEQVAQPDYTRRQSN